MRYMRFALFLASAAILSAQPPPKFESFAVKDRFTGTPAKPVIRTRRQLLFRTPIGDSARNGPNFAGHYTVETWSCGAECSMLAIADAAGGNVYDPPFARITFPPSYRYEGLPGGIIFHLDSRLLIVRGCFGPGDCASAYYEWVGEDLKLIRKVPGVSSGK
jgi:hypothetical protein